MTDSDDNLKMALAQNGSFDREKAEKTGQTAVATFITKMKKVERYVWGYGIICKCVAIFAVLQLLHSTSTRGMIMNAVVALLMCEMIQMLKLWYWILNNKFSVLKEIKQLRAETSVLTEATGSPRLKDLVAEPVQGLSRWERRLWWYGYVVCVVLVFVVKMPDVQRVMVQEDTMVHNGYVTLAADGSSTTVTKTSSPNRGVVPATSFPFEVPSGSTIRWVNDRGQELPVTVSTQDGRDRYTVSLIDPALPGERLTYKRIAKTPGLAVKEGDIWTCRADWGFGPQFYRYNETVMLPKGAEIVSVNPEPDHRFVTSTGQPVLRYKADCGSNEHFTYTIQYRLPAEPDR